MYQEHDVHTAGYATSDCRNNQNNKTDALVQKLEQAVTSESEGKGEHFMAELPTSAQIRHESEVRTISKWSKERIRGFLEFVEQKRSPESYRRLRADLIKAVGML
jgi:hypothetical protein